MDVTQLNDLAHRAQQDAKLPVKSRKIKGVTYKNTFSGKEFIDWLSSQDAVSKAKEASDVAHQMFSAGLIVSPEGAKEFKDLSAYYQLKGVESDDNKKIITKSTGRSRDKEDKKTKLSKSKGSETEITPIRTSSDKKKPLGRSLSGKDLTHSKISSYSGSPSADAEFSPSKSGSRTDLMSGHRNTPPSGPNRANSFARPLPGDSPTKISPIVPPPSGGSDSLLTPSGDSIPAPSYIPPPPILSTRDDPPPPSYIPEPPPPSYIPEPPPEEGSSKRKSAKRKKEVKRRKSKGMHSKLKSSLLADDETETASTNDYTGSVEGTSRSKVSGLLRKKPKKSKALNEATEALEDSEYDQSILQGEENSMWQESEMDTTVAPTADAPVRAPTSISIRRQNTLRSTLPADEPAEFIDDDTVTQFVTVPSPRSMSAEVELLKWNFQDADRNSKFMCLKGGALLGWDIPNQWAVARASTALSGFVFYELCKVGGTSQQLQVGIGCGDVDCSSSIKQTQFGKARLGGSWLLYKIKSPLKAGDRIGVLVNMNARWMYVYKNYQPLRHLKFQQSFSKAPTVGSSFYPFVALASDIQIEITQKPILNKYRDIKFSSESKSQLEKPTTTGTTTTNASMAELLDIMNVVNHRSLLLEYSLESLTKETLNSLQLPTLLVQKLWNFRNLIMASTEEQSASTEPVATTQAAVSPRQQIATMEIVDDE